MGAALWMSPKLLENRGGRRNKEDGHMCSPFESESVAALRLTGALNPRADRVALDCV